MRHGPCRAHIVENNHRSNNVACPIVDRRSGIFYGRFKRIAADKDTIDSQTDRPILLHGHLHGILSGQARCSINNLEDFDERFADGFFAGPSGHGLGNKIEIGDVAGNVRTENGVTNRVEGDQGAFFFHVQRIFDGLAFNRVAQCTRQ